MNYLFFEVSPNSLEEIKKEYRMNIKMLKAAVAGLVLSVSSLANAGLIFDSGSSTTNIGGLCGACGPVDTHTIFDDFVLTDSINSFYLDWDASFYNSASGFDVSSSVRISIWDNANADMLFSTLVSYSALDLISTNVIIGPNTNSTVGTTLSGVALTAGDYWISFSGTNMHFGGTGNAFQRGLADLGNGTSTNHNGNANFRISTLTNKVPEPTTLAIFALGIMGLASRRFKKES